MDDMERKVIDVVEPYVDNRLWQLPYLAERIVALFAPEIERLRAEADRHDKVAQNLNNERNAALMALTDARRKAAELQAKIDAYAKASVEVSRIGADWERGDQNDRAARWEAARIEWERADAALQAAATKEDDHVE